MKISDKIKYIQDNHFSYWLRVRRDTEDDMSGSQTMFCICGKLASGMHERVCRKFQDAVTNETIKQLSHLIPKTTTTNAKN